MKTILFLAGAACLLPFAAAAQLVATTTSRPAAMASISAPLSTQLVAGGTSITYFGTVCSHDCQHEQFARLRQAFATARPTLVFFENPDSGTDSTEAATIKEQGEGGYVRFLAQQYQVPVLRLDDPEAEYAYLQTKLDPERLKLFCLLREVQRFRARTGASKALAKKAMQSFLKNSESFISGTAGVIHNQAELEAAYQKYCPAGGKWWEAPAAWFNPAATEASLSNANIEQYKEAVREYRAQALYGKLLEKAQAGQRVLVVLSRNNLPLVRPLSLAQH